MKKKLVSGLLVAAMSLSMLAGSIVSLADEATDAVLKDGDTTEILMVWPGSNASPASMQEV